MITCSIKLWSDNFINVSPHLLLLLLGEEFVSITGHELKDAYYSFTEENDIGTVMFNQEIARLYKADDRYYLYFEDGRVFFVNVEDEL